jgi:hypothetical protein
MAALKYFKQGAPSFTGHVAGSSGNPGVLAYQGAPSMEPGAIVVIILGALLSVIILTSLVCFIMVVVKMFQHDQTGLGIACILLSLCSGIGTLIAFVYGWVKASDWKIQPLMAVWTGCFILILLMGIATPIMITIVGSKANQTFLTVGSSLTTGGSRP